MLDSLFSIWSIGLGGIDKCRKKQVESYSMGRGDAYILNHVLFLLQHVILYAFGGVYGLQRRQVSNMGSWKLCILYANRRWFSRPSLGATMKKCVVLACTHFFFGVVYSLGVMLLDPGKLTCYPVSEYGRYWLFLHRNGWFPCPFGYLSFGYYHVSILCVDFQFIGCND